MRVTNEITYKRIRQSIADLENLDIDMASPLIQVLLGRGPAEFDPPIENLNFLSDVNESQKEAVRFALAAKHVALIHGPPGTGKTTTLVEIINQLLQQSINQRPVKILACGPSNLSVGRFAIFVISCERCSEYS
jgi:DNA polymerase alpha-associated DNA helicase A